MKKIFAVLITLAFVLSSILNIAANSNMGSIEESTINSKNLSTQKLKLLKEANISLSDITVVDETKVFSEEQLQKMKEEDDEMLKRGLKKVEAVYFINNNLTKTSNTFGVNATSSDLKWVDGVRQYNSQTTTLNNSSKGMRYWLDVAWNLVIGSTTKYIWKAATIFALNPSNFLPNGVSGDSLTNHYQYVYYDRMYQMQNPRDSNWYNCVRISRLELTNYVDLYTLDVNNKAVRKSTSTTTSYYTKHYPDYNWVIQQAKVNVTYCGMTVTLDTFE
jgi:hypothetical protein